MRVLLVGNYPPNRQQSMQRYAQLLQQRMSPVVDNLDLVTPSSLFPRSLETRGELAKWIGHFEKFILFPIELVWRRRAYNIVHLCDHGNALYLFFLPRKRTLITCHDCLAIRAARGSFVETQTRWTGRVAQRLILAALRRAHHIVCVSETTRQDLARLIGRSTIDIALVPNVLSYPYRPMRPPEAAGHLRRLGLVPNRRYFLHVGNDSWYKNRGGALEVYRKLTDMEQFRDHLMVLIGRALPSALAAWVTEHELVDRVAVVEDVSGEELCALYSAADALLFPSLQEGFGWPIIEAQACGCLVVTSRREPMMSVAGGGAILIDPSDPCQAGHEIASRWQDRETLVSKGFDNVRRYDAAQFVEGYLEIYDRVRAAAEG
jgi:glycosyltransferase involved in cell wall biosynthesis